MIRGERKRVIEGHETYELFCEECGKKFESLDCEATLCHECWEKIMEDLFREETEK